MLKKIFVILIVLNMILTGCSTSLPVDKQTSNSNDASAKDEWPEDKEYWKDKNKPEDKNKSEDENKPEDEDKPTDEDKPDDVINEDENKDFLKIIEMKIPKHFIPLGGMEGNIKYSYHDKDDVEIYFDRNLKEQDTLLGLLMFGSYYVLENNAKKHGDDYDEYRINGNCMSISSHSLVGKTVHTIFIPKNIIAIDGAQMKKDEALLFTSDYYTGEYLSSDYTHIPIARETKSSLLMKEKDDQRNIAFVNNNAFLYSDKEAKGASMDIFKGETVEVKQVADGMSYVEIYFIKNYKLYLFDSSFEIEEREGYNVLKGYIRTESLTTICEPLNQGTKYTVKIKDIDDNTTGVYFCIYPKLYGKYEILLGENITQIDENDIHICESMTIFDWVTILSGEGYLNGYGRSMSLALAPEDERQHFPEKGWNKERYDEYLKAYDGYCKAIINETEKFAVQEDVENFRSDIKALMENRMIAEMVWIEWGYKDQLKNANYFFDEMIKRQDLSTDVRKQYEEIVKKLEHSDFEDKFSKILNIEMKNLADYYESTKKGIYDKYSNVKELVVE